MKNKNVPPMFPSMHIDGQVQLQHYISMHANGYNKDRQIQLPNKQLLDSNHKLESYDEFYEPVFQVWGEAYQNNYYPLDQKDPNQYPLAPQGQHQEMALFQYQPPFEMFDPFLGDPKRDIFEPQFFEDPPKQFVNNSQPTPYLMSFGPAKQEEQEFKANYQQQGQFPQFGIPDLNNNITFGRQAFFDEFLLPQYKQNVTPQQFYQQQQMPPSPNHVEKNQSLQFLLQNPQIIQKIQQQQQIQQPQAQQQQPQQNYFNPPVQVGVQQMVNQYKNYNHLLNQQKNIFMPQPHYPTQQNYQLYPSAFFQGPPPPQHMGQQLQPIHMNHIPQVTQAVQTQIQPPPKNEQKDKGSQIVQQVNRKVLQSVEKFENHSLIPNQQNLKSLIRDQVNGPFSASNVKKTDTFISKFLDISNLRKIKEGLTSELINHFSSMNLEDLLNFQSKPTTNKVAPTQCKRIGALTQKERQLKIAKYKQKRRQRKWDKKINYDCRKQVADKRERIKGRFVTKNQESILNQYKQQMHILEMNQRMKEEADKSILGQNNDDLI